MESTFSVVDGEVKAGQYFQPAENHSCRRLEGSKLSVISAQLSVRKIKGRCSK